ncbi:hypothetical protein [Gluconobacter cerinus]|uniref:hypothetical protein n=1 Tax=Gluconobacter cerinus TaxID=38307 RepID=UPI001B8C3F78|nr:hypothetical protein [Gluconobacter cerinus]MBS0994751.1 hypothetical protein [Gluconobacter cerinus]
MSVQKLLKSTYDYNEISALDDAPSLEEIFDQKLFDIEKFEEEGTKLLDKYSGKPD